MQKNALCGRWTRACAQHRYVTKTLLVMKLTMILLTAVIVQVSARGLSQTVSFNGKNTPLQEVLSVVKKQTGFAVIYNTGLLDRANPVSLNVVNVPLKNFLQDVFKNQPLEFSIENRTIVISRKSSVSNDAINVTGVDAMLSPSSLIRGRVLDVDGVPLAGVTITLKGRKVLAVTNVEGVFSVNVSVGDVLVISSIGFESTESKITSAIVASSDQQSTSGTISLVISLKRKESQLDAVTINAGYYTVTEKTRTGNIAKVMAKDIERQPVTSPLMALQGRMAGVDITPYNGAPGNTVKIEIRGDNSLQRFSGSNPLYVIDGVPIESQPIRSGSVSLYDLGFDPLSTINPAQIERIEVLKDGDATAIYGSRGANGVILITTKQGGVTGKTNFDVSAYTGVGKIANRLDVLNTQQFIAMRKEAFSNVNSAPGLLDFDLNGAWDTTRYTDWQKELLGGTSNITDLQADVSGGNGQTTFRLGGGFHNETSVFSDNFRFRQLTGHFSLNHASSNDKFHVTISTNYGAIKNKQFNDLNFVQQALTLPPNAPSVYDENGNLNWDIISLFGGLFKTPSWTNPYAALKKTDESSITNLIANGTISYEIVQGLTLKSNIGYSELHSDEIVKQPIESQAPSSFSTVTGSSTFGTNSRKTFIVEPQVIYNREFGNHELNIIVGSTLQESLSTYQSVTGQGYTSDILLNSILAATERRYNADDNINYRYIAFFSRIGYDWKDKYFLNLTGRRDGSSRFGPGRQFGNFGAIGAAWTFSKEPFISNNIGFISFGKLRGSYGITGNDQIGDYQFYNTYSISSNQYLNNVTLNPTALYNPDFSWEETKKLEAAIELGFIKNRIMIEASWYRNRSSNQLVNFTLPTTTGYQSVLSNFDAIIQNSGWEFLLTTRNIQSKNLIWTSSFNFSIPKNKLIKYDGIENSPYASYYKVGQPLSIQRLYTWLGVDPQTGEHKILDINDDGIINDADKTFMKPVGRKCYGGVLNTIRYKNLEVSFLIQFSKADKANYLLDYFIPGTRGYNQPIEVLNRWRKEGDITDVSKFDPYYPQNNLFMLESNHNTRDASFFRVKTANLSYDFPASLSKNLHLKSAKIYLQAQNLLTFTNYPQFDPESGNGVPPLRIISLGLQVKL